MFYALNMCDHTKIQIEWHWISIVQMTMGEQQMKIDDNIRYNPI